MRCSGALLQEVGARAIFCSLFRRAQDGFLRACLLASRLIRTVVRCAIGALLFQKGGGVPGTGPTLAI